MARSRQTEAEIIERIRRERTRDGDALVDMRLDIEVDGEIVLSVGGLWDNLLGDYDGDAVTAVTVQPHPGQVAAVRWFRTWLGVHAGRRNDPPPPPSDEDEIVSTNPDEAYSAMLAGGRRAGKTWLANVFCAIYAIQFPGSIVWIVNPTDEDHDEVRRYMSVLLDPRWVSRETQADGWELVNGSAIMLKSAYVGADPDAIKKGEANFVLLNEGQKQAHRVYVVARGAISDHSGLVLVCANPPVQAKDQQWVADFAAEAQRGKRQSVYFHFNPLDNPHINRHSLFALRAEVDRRTFRIEVLGEFLGDATNVAYNWDRTPVGNERPMPRPDDPNWEDVTSIFLEMHEEGDGLINIVGLDFQVHPHIGGPVYRVFAPRTGAIDDETVVVWGVDEVVLDGGDEEALCVELFRKEYDPATTLLVGDATGQYQHTRRRSVDSPPPTWQGKGSFDIIRSSGYPHIVPPSRRFQRKNPDVIDRARSFTSLIENADLKRRLFLDPDRCPRTCKAIREWPTVHGKPSRTHEAAHLGDAASYPIVRLFPRIYRSGTTPPVTTKPNGLAPLQAPGTFRPAHARPRGGRVRGL